MDQIVTRIYELIKETDDLIEFEQQLRLYMYDTFASLVGEGVQPNRQSHQRKQAVGAMVGGKTG